MPTTTTAASPSSAATATMRALVKARPDVGLDFDPQRPLPTGSHGRRGEPGPREALIRVHMAGVCGTDKHIWEWDEWASGRIPVGIVTGHEFVGVVEKIGAAVSRVEVGQRVSAEGHITSGTDYNSRTGNAHIAKDMQILGVDRDGCFADYVIVPEENVWQIHDDIPDHYAAVLDPLGNAVHTVMSAGVSTKTVLITGVGMIGLMSVPVARAAGAARIFAVDTNPRNLELARKLGAEQTFQVGKDNDWVERVIAETRGDGVDVLLEMSGAAPAIDAGFNALRRGGVAAILGIPREPLRFDLTNHVIFKGSTVIGVNGRRMWETWYQMENLLLSGRVKLDDIITHTIPLEDYATAFNLLLENKALKIVLDLNGPTR